MNTQTQLSFADRVFRLQSNRQAGSGPQSIPYAKPGFGMSLDFWRVSVGFKVLAFHRVIDYFIAFSGKSNVRWGAGSTGRFAEYLRLNLLALLAGRIRMARSKKDGFGEGTCH